MRGPAEALNKPEPVVTNKIRAKESNGFGLPQQQSLHGPRAGKPSAAEQSEGTAEAPRSEAAGHTCGGDPAGAAHTSSDLGRLLRAGPPAEG